MKHVCLGHRISLRGGFINGRFDTSRLECSAKLGKDTLGQLLRRCCLHGICVPSRSEGWYLVNSMALLMKFRSLWLEELEVFNGGSLQGERLSGRSKNTT